jgi:hypothetical protein
VMISQVPERTPNTKRSPRQRPGAHVAKRVLSEQGA